MYEHHSEKLLPGRLFLSRVVRHAIFAAAVLLMSLVGGIMGFHYLASQDWLDAYLNAAMLLGGMGPVGAIDRPEGKLFAGLYALYAGIVFLAASAVLLAPVVHRVLHKFHISEKSEPQ